MDIRELVAEEDLEAGQEAVGLVHLRSPTPLYHESCFRVVGRSGCVAFEQGHPMPGPGQRERGGVTADAPSYNDSVLHGDPLVWQRPLPHVT